MALSLTEGECYSTTDILSKTVIDRLVKDDPILKNLKFEELLGNSDTYVTVTTRSGAAFYSVGDTWVESTPSVTQATVTLTILGGDADLDNFLLDTRSNKLDMKGTVLNDKTLAVKEKFLDQFYYGTAADASGFSGLQQLMTSTTYNTVHAGAVATGGALTVAKFREAIDLVTGFKPQLIVMSKSQRRLLATYADSVGDKMPGMVTELGTFPTSFDNIPIAVSDHIGVVETISGDAFAAKTGGACTSLFILNFDSSACQGVQGSSGLKVIPLGNLETKDAQRFRIKWYVGMKLMNLRSCAKMDGIDYDAACTA